MTDRGGKAVILAVDDTPENLDVVKGALGDEYVIKAAINGMIALKIAEKAPPDLILLVESGLRRFPHICKLMMPITLQYRLLCIVSSINAIRKFPGERKNIHTRRIAINRSVRIYRTAVQTYNDRPEQI